MAWDESGGAAWSDAADLPGTARSLPSRSTSFPSGAHVDRRSGASDVLAAASLGARHGSQGRKPVRQGPSAYDPDPSEFETGGRSGGTATSQPLEAGP